MSTLRPKEEHLKLLQSHRLANKHRAYQYKGTTRRQAKRSLSTNNKMGRPLVGLETQLVSLASKPD